MPSSKGLISYDCTRFVNHPFTDLPHYGVGEMPEYSVATITSKPADFDFDKIRFKRRQPFQTQL